MTARKEREAALLSNSELVFCDVLKMDGKWMPGFLEWANLLFQIEIPKSPSTLCWLIAVFLWNHNLKMANQIIRGYKIQIIIQKLVKVHTNFASN